MADAAVHEPEAMAGLDGEGLRMVGHMGKATAPVRTPPLGSAVPRGRLGRAALAEGARASPAVTTNKHRGSLPGPHQTPSPYRALRRPNPERSGGLTLDGLATS
jgi:hypothetical protein